MKTIDKKRSIEDDHNALLEALVRINVRYLSRHETAPVKDAVKYRRRLDEDYRDIPTVLQQGYGDAEDLVSWRVAELRHSGEDPAAKPMLMIRKLPIGSNGYTVFVARGDGRMETWDGEEP